MGNVPIPFHGLRLNEWTTDKKLLIWRTVSMSSCIVGSSIYMNHLEPYLEVPIFGILVPTFIIGYIIINSSEMFMLFTDQNYIFLEVCFAVTGAIGSLICGFYEFVKWIKWTIDTSRESDDHDLSEFVLATVLLLNGISLSAVVFYRLRQHYSSTQ